MNDFIRKISKTDTRTILALFLAFGILSYQGLLMCVKIPQENLSLIQQTVPMTITTLGIVVGYYFGSTKTDPKKEGEQ